MLVYTGIQILWLEDRGMKFQWKVSFSDEDSSEAHNPALYGLYCSLDDDDVVGCL